MIIDYVEISLESGQIMFEKSLIDTPFNEGRAEDKIITCKRPRLRKINKDHHMAQLIELGR